MRTFSRVFNTLDLDLDSLLDVVLGGLDESGDLSKGIKSIFPEYDVKEEKKEGGAVSYIYSIPMPGIKKEDIKITCKKNGGIKNMYIEVTKGSNYVKEGKTTIQLHRDASLTGTLASLIDGVLNVTIDRDPESFYEETVKII